MSIDSRHFVKLTTLRDELTVAIGVGDTEEMHRAYGVVQGYLICLCEEEEIDAAEMKALEEEILGCVPFLINAQRASACR